MMNIKSIKKVNFRKVFTYSLIVLLLTGVQNYAHFRDDYFIEKNDFIVPNELKLSSPIIEPNWSYTTGSDILSIGISDDGRYIAVGSWDHKLYFFQNSSSTPLWSYDTGGTVPSVSISSDGSYIAIGNGWPDYSVYLFHKSSSTPIWKYTSGSGYPNVAISGDGSHIAVAGSQTHKIYLFHRLSSTPLWSYDTGNLITAVSISEDGRYIAAGGHTDDVYLFENSSSTPVWSYTTNDNIRKIDISSDGEYFVAGGSGNNVYLFNNSGTTPMWSYDIGDRVQSVAISSNGQNIAVGGFNHKVYFFDTLNSNPLWNYTTGDIVYCVDLSSQGDFIFAGSADKRIYLFEKFSSEPLWNYQTGDKIGSDDIQHCARISPEGNYLVAGSFDDNIYYFEWNPLRHLRLYTDAMDPHPVGSFNLLWNNITDANNYSVYYHTQYISEINSSVSLLDQGITSNTHLITGLGNGSHYFKTVACLDNLNFSSNCINVKVVDEIVKPTVNIKNHNSHVEFLEGILHVNATVKDNSGLAKVQINISRSDDSVVGQYTMNHIVGDTYSAEWHTINDFPGNYTFTIIAEDILGNINDTESGKFEIVNTHQKIPLWTSLPGDGISDVAMSSNGDYMVVGGNDKIYLFNKTSSAPMWSYSTTYGGRYVGISSNGSYIVAANGGGGAGKLFLFSKSSSTPLWIFNVPQAALAVAISSDGEYIALGSYDWTVRLFHRSSSTPIWTYSAPIYISSIDISSNGSYIVAGAGSAEDRAKIFLFEKSSSIPLWTYRLARPIFSVTISSDGNYIVAGSGSHDNKIYLFNKTSSTPMWTFSTGGYQVKSVKISEDNNYIVAGIENGGGKVYLFNRSSPIPLWSYTTGINPHLNTVAISGNGSYIIAGNWEYYGDPMDMIEYGNIYFFHKSSNIPLWHYRTGRYVGAVAISSDGIYCAGGSSDGVHFFDNEMSMLAFTLTSDADNPDTDGIFNLSWTSSKGALNYSIFSYDKYITEINGSLTLLEDQTATSPYAINISTGTYYYVVVAHNNVSNVLSNCIKIVVQLEIENDPPSIFINSPTPDYLFGNNSPNFNVRIKDESGISKMWYTIDEGLHNFTFTSNETIDQPTWNSQPDGTVKIQFYANDTVGNSFLAEVTVKKDTLSPEIDILFPAMNDVFNYAPAYEIAITDPNLDTIWYSLDEGAHNFTIIELIGIIDQETWDDLPNGHVKIIFYANDTLGSTNLEEVIVVKDTPPGPGPPEISGYNLFILIGISCAIVIITIKLKLKRKIEF